MDFFTKVYAQSVTDSVAQSTIPFSPPGVTSTPFVTATPSVPKIYLEADKIQLAINDTADIKVHINTAGVAIQSFKMIINYDSNYFSITDNDPAQPNVQVAYEDTFFLPTVNVVDTVNGSIDLEAASNEGTATVSDRIVAEFYLTSLKEGATNVTINQANSNMLDSNSTDILASTGQPLSFVINNVIVTPSQPVPTPTGKLPRNGFFDTLGASQAFTIGILLIFVGAYLIKNQRNAKKTV